MKTLFQPAILLMAGAALYTVPADCADYEIQFSTMLGGLNHDRAYAVEVDESGHIYVSGRSGPRFPVTSGAFQTTFQGTNNGIYGVQNAFVVKLRAQAWN